MPQVLIIGVAVVDFVFAVGELPTRAAKHRAKHAEIVGGGCAANAAVAVARLGGQALLGARLGDDALGDLIVSDLVRDGVDTRLVQRSGGGQSSFSSIYVDQQGERQIMNFRGQGLTQETRWIATAPAVDAVLVDTRWSQGALEGLRLAKSLGVPGIVDAEAPMDFEVLAEASHVAFSRDGLLSFYKQEASPDQGAALEAALREAADRLSCWVCVTDGAQGCFHLDGPRLVHEPALPVHVKDTLAAGDVWHGAFALALAEGQDEAFSVRFANAAAALKCQTFGGRKGSPDRTAVTNFLEEMQKCS